MEVSLNLQAMRELVEVEARSYYHSRWNHLEQQASVEFDRSRLAHLDAVGRFESNLVNRFTQSKQLSYQHGFSQANTVTRATVLQMELGQARRQHNVPSTSLRNELQAAPAQIGHLEHQGPSQDELDQSRAHRGQLQVKLTQAHTHLNVLQNTVTMRDEQVTEQLSQKQLETTTHGAYDAALRTELASAQEKLTQLHATRLANVRDNHTSM
eukprot:6484939-Amphidinium_carterae.1